ncbi:MAG: DUF177 domain-containing protein [Pseudomonadota bacterium]
MARRRDADRTPAPQNSDGAQADDVGTAAGAPLDLALPLPLEHPVAVGALVETGGLTVELRPEAAERAAIADYLGLAALEQLAFRAEITPQDEGWLLAGRLSAALSQPCVVTLEPVPSEIETTMERRYLPGVTPPAGNEIELDADADAAPEALGDAIDVAAPMIETLALSLDPFPRAPGAEHGTRSYGPPGAEPLTDEAAKPFAGLAALKTRIGGNGDGDGDGAA